VLPTSVPVQVAHEEISAGSGDLDRTAGVITLAGCSSTFLATFMPVLLVWAVGASAPAIGNQAAGIPLAILAIASAGIASVVLFRRPAPARVGITLIVLAVLQLGLATWFGSSIVLAIERADSHLVLISAIGTGAYLSVLGSAMTLVGGVLAWTGRATKVSVTSRL
jgi:hypothetical protein